MHLYILKAKKHQGVTIATAFDFDCRWGLVVSATSVVRARKLAAKLASDEGAEVWLNPKTTTCKLLRPGRTERMIIEDFHAG